METGLKVALVTSFTGVIAAAIAAFASISAAREANSANKQSTSTLNEAQKLLRVVYDNGSMSNSSFAGGKLVFTLNGSRKSGPTHVPLDMSRIGELCGDIDGCIMTLGATRFRVQVSAEIGGNITVEAPLWGGPCRFFYDPKTKFWTFSDSCVAAYGTYKLVGEGPARRWEWFGAYQMYQYSNTFGIDDDNQELTVISFRGACYIAESAPDQKINGGHFLPDVSADTNTGGGLFLIASSPSWDYPGAYPENWQADDSARRCILIVEN